MTLENILEKHSLYEENPDLALVRRAYSFAEVAHFNQKRLNGEDMIQHPLAVADILTQIKADSVTLAAALLHDVLEETNLSAESLSQEMGEEIVSLVVGLTVVKQASDKVNKDSDPANLSHLILATVHDPRVLAIRLAEKIHNMRTAYALDEDSRRIAAKRVFDIWGTLAELAGLHRFKAELEDLAFAVLEPQKCRELEQLVKKESEVLSETINLAKDTLGVAANREKIPVQIFGRTKHLYSVYKKLDRYKKSAHGKLFDVLGLRILVGSVENCYRILDVARRFWEEEPNLFDDYIANPKPNGYQSIHAVFQIEGNLMEIQIRTKGMHEVAEYGLAAHPLYKEDHSPQGGSVDRVSMVRNLVLWEKGAELNLFPDKVFVITPKGDVKVLPAGSTPVDFAYAVHSRVGDECKEAKVDGKLKALNYSLQTGEMVEIITKKGKKPSADWLKFVKTGQARDAVEKALRLGQA